MSHNENQVRIALGNRINWIALALVLLLAGCVHTEVITGQVTVYFTDAISHQTLYKKSLEEVSFTNIVKMEDGFVIVDRKIKTAVIYFEMPYEGPLTCDQIVKAANKNEFDSDTLQLRLVVNENSYNACRAGSYFNPLKILQLDGTMTTKRRYRMVNAGSICRDGSISSSSGSGACSWHKGVLRAYYRKSYLD